MASTMIEPDHATREELAEAITNMAATAARMPAHWAERRGKIHEQINRMLDALEALPA
jgi:hypothetical protein